MPPRSTSPVKGMRDIIGKQARLKKWIEKTIQECAYRYAFEPVQFPILEHLETLTIKGGGGEEAAKELYLLDDQSGRKLGLRFEHTTSLARVLAGNPDLPKPVKTFNMGTVYRYDNPQAMRYREFTQADCDIIGTTHPAADAECISFAIDVMKELGFTQFFIRINDRRIINELLTLCDIPPAKSKDAMRILDKLDKIGLEGVKEELEKQFLSTSILAYMESPLSKIKKELTQAKLDLTGVTALEQLFDTIATQKKQSYLKFDPSLMRGLEYYTGTVFEVFAGARVSVGGGGRFDELIQSLGGLEMPAVGISFGVDRLMDILIEKWDEERMNAYILPIGKVYPDAQQLAGKLREKGLRIELDLMGRSIGKNMNYANTKKFPYVVFLGEDELKQNSVKIRNMESGEEKMVKTTPLDSLIKELTSHSLPNPKK
ncbi:MAG: histidine--tRNA ligase [Candidatus Diapherotrites archaeon]